MEHRTVDPKVEGSSPFGNEVHRQARFLYPEGILVKGDEIPADDETKFYLDDPDINVIFEATFRAGECVAKADILLRKGEGWHIYEVKSSIQGKPEFLYDISYTTSIVQSELKVVGCSLLLLNPEYRLGMPVENMFVRIDHTEEAKKKAKKFWSYYDEVYNAVRNLQPGNTGLKWACRNCDEFIFCEGLLQLHPIFNLPRLSHVKFCQLRDLNISEIDEIPDDFNLTENQQKVRQAVISDEPWIDKDGLIREFNRLIFPLYFLDFESIATAIPLYENTTPYERIPFQYSLHVCAESGEVVAHHEYLAEPRRDCRRELAERLLIDCGTEGSVLCYGSFERSVINDLAQLFPDLAVRLNRLAMRLADLCEIIRKYYYHRDFHGSYSIKKVLPVLVSDLGYDDLEIGDGGDAMAIYAEMAMGKMDEGEQEEARENLLQYNNRDTEGMVRLWDVLRKMLEED